MMTLTSPAFQNDRPIPKAHTGEGEDSSPALAWSGAPAGTKSFALIMDDPDAPVGTWVHWVIYDIPAKCAGLPQGAPKGDDGPSGSKQGACWGVDRFERVGYFGPLPPPGKTHRYAFRLYALDAVLGLEPRATAAQLRSACAGHVLAEAALIGTYRR